MSKQKAGRNDPCPCGSGLKYKQCCREKDRTQAAAADRAQAAARQQATQDAYRETQDLDEASNAVVDLIDAGRLDEAERAARGLLERYPEVPDGHERLGMVYEARGERARAAESYRACLQLVQAEAGAFDPGYRQFLTEKIQELTTD
jgi:tetratricopeptide (TPR) repeat protein